MIKDLITDNHDFDAQQKIELIGTEMEVDLTPDFSRFTMKELHTWLLADGNPLMTDFTVTPINGLDEDEPIYVPEAFNLQIYKGSENIYLEVDVYLLERAIFEPFFLKVWSKEDHDKVKELANEIIKQA